MFYLIGIIITFFLAVLLLTKKSKTVADKILSAWLVVMCIHLFLFYNFISGNYKEVPYFLGLGFGFPLLHGPFLLLYTRALTGIGKIGYRSLFHAIPFFLIYLFLWRFLSLPLDQKIRVYQEEGAGYEMEMQVMAIAAMISGVVYVAMSLLLLRRHRKRIENNFSNTERINLNWLRYIIGGILIIWLIVLARLNDTYIFSAVVVYVFFIGYFGIRQVGIFTNPVVALPDVNENSSKDSVSSGVPTELQAITTSMLQEQTAEGDEEPGKIKYQKSALGEEEARQIHLQLQLLMKTEKPYQDPDLTLTNLSQKIGVHPNILSQVINSFEKKNFYEYINEYRIENFKQLIRSPENQKYTLLSLAFECGFNSKTAFNRNFKKATGLSPSDYMTQQQAQTSNNS